jgi:hypothetical protein
MSVAIVDYGSGNLHSAAKAFERAARESGHDQPIKVTRDPEDVRRAERVVLPGVGAFADCRRGLDAVLGMAANEPCGAARAVQPCCHRQQNRSQAAQDPGGHGAEGRSGRGHCRAVVQHLPSFRLTPRASSR